MGGVGKWKDAKAVSSIVKTPGFISDLLLTHQVAIAPPVYGFFRFSPSECSFFANIASWSNNDRFWYCCSHWGGVLFFPLLLGIITPLYQPWCLCSQYLRTLDSVFFVEWRHEAEQWCLSLPCWQITLDVANIVEQTSHGDKYVLYWIIVMIIIMHGIYYISMHKDCMGMMMSIYIKKGAVLILKRMMQRIDPKSC